MAQGKFSHPRPHRDEERQIEQAYRQVTGQKPVYTPQSSLYHEDATIAETIRQINEEPPVSPDPSRQANPGSGPAQNPSEAFDFLPENLDFDFREDAPTAEPDAYEGEPDFLDQALNFLNAAMEYCRKNQKVVLVVLCAIALSMIIGFIGIFFASTADPYEKKILNNVYAAGIHLGGMSKKEAISILQDSAAANYTTADMVIDLSGTELKLSPKDTGVKLDVKAAVNEAYDYGRTGTKAEKELALKGLETQPHIIGLLPYLDLNTQYIVELLSSYAGDSGSTLTQTSYGLEGTQPELATDKFDANATPQTLVITLGTPGVGFDVNQVYTQVLDAYSLCLFRVEVEAVTDVTKPDPIDLEAIYQEYYIAPVDATVNMQTFEAQPGSYGYGFDLEEAQKLIDKADYGDEIRIPMEYIEPDILDADAFFRDTLGEYQTKAIGSSGRIKNLELACQAIHNTVLNPGETLLFSNALKNVSGFQNAPEDTGREDVPQGGVSQVSSTLYYAALLADLEITARANHGFLPSFIDHGLDATTSLNVRNSTAFPVRIEAEVSGGYVKIRIIGTEERDYFLALSYAIVSTSMPQTEYKDFEINNREGYKDEDVIEAGVNGYTVKSYKVKFDSQTARELSRDFITNSHYPSEKKIVARVKPVETTAPTTEPTTVPTTATPTTEPTSAPTSAPATEPTSTPTTEPTSTPTTAPTVAPTIPDDVPQSGDGGSEQAA